ncbi:hypothetical protein SAMN04489742_2962 [Arthrobacter crystallopoietes]|uniref:Uncharacterized protein n=1 Tax=Crystallibacter crystallopoietes TaxID=37928 RepID=A0A1H1EJ15_9MICC|nr:hypothetical protein SAMN04489742_2962 [Arthrobacter crystallopoietes]
MPILTIDTEAMLVSAAAAQGAADRSADLRVDAVSRTAAAAGMSGWETEAMEWGQAYDDAAVQILTSLERLGSAYASAGFHTRAAAELYRFTEQLASGKDHPYAAPQEPAAPALCRQLPVSAVGGRIPVLPEFGQFIADAAGERWPSGDADAMRATAGAWRMVGADLRALGSEALRTTTAPLAGQRGADIVLLESHQEELYLSAVAVAEGCDALGRDCDELAGAVEEAHAALVQEARDFGLQIAALIGMGAVTAWLTAGGGLIITTGLVATRVGQAVAAFLAATGRLGTQVKPLITTTLDISRKLAGIGRLTELAQRSLPGPLGMQAVAMGTFARSALHSAPVAAARSFAAKHASLAAKQGDRLLSVAASGPEALLTGALTGAVRKEAQGAAGMVAKQVRPVAGRAGVRMLNPDVVSPAVLGAYSAYGWYSRMNNTMKVWEKEGWLGSSRYRSGPPRVDPASVWFPAPLKFKLGTGPQPEQPGAAARGSHGTGPMGLSSPDRRKDDLAVSR